MTSAAPAIADVATADRLYYASACNLTNDDVAGMTEEELDSCLGLNASVIEACRQLTPGATFSAPWHAGGEITFRLATLGEMLRRIAFRERESATYAFKQSREAWAAKVSGSVHAELAEASRRAHEVARKAEDAADIVSLQEDAARQAALKEVRITERSLSTRPAKEGGQMADSTNSLVVVFRTGGTDNFRWNRTLRMNREQAESAKAEIIRGGRPAMIVNAHLSEVIGLPETFDANDPVDTDRADFDFPPFRAVSP